MPNPTPHSPPPDDSADWEALARYFAGESTDGERAEVQRWLEAHPSEAAALGSLNEATGQLVRATPAGLDVEAALRRVNERRDGVDVLPIGSRPPPLRAPAPARRWRTFVLPAAAAAVLLVGAGLVWHSARAGGYTQPTVAAQTFATVVGKRDSVRLPDGTRVLLAPESQLIVAAGYGDDVREVELRGEAYFDVQHDPDRPFLVRAGGAAIRDLGTTFTVRATGDRGVRVVVTSGSVSLGTMQTPSDRAAVLQPGDVGTLGADGRTLVERGGANESDTSWTRGRLVFSEASVASVQSELRRWYGIDVEIDSSFATRHLSMTFDGEPVDRVLQVIALSLGAEVERRGDTAAVIKPASPRAR